RRVLFRSNEILSEARSTAQQERSVAAALADTNAQTTNDDNATSGPDATLAQPTGNLGVAGVQQRALPATAIDSAGSALQTRTLVRSEERRVGKASRSVEGLEAVMWREDYVS